MTPTPVEAFFNGYFEGLDGNHWPNVVLHSWLQLPEQIPSDVDYLVSSVSPRRLLSFLDHYCRSQGWILAQVMEHEPQSYYCVCFMSAAPWHSLKLDVAWDYHRKGRKLLSGSFLLESRHKPDHKSFHVPSPSAEFSYTLAKGLAKSKGPEQVRKRLEELWSQTPGDCQLALNRYFEIHPPSPSGAFPSAIIEAALEPENPAFKKWRVRRWGFAQALWLVRRLRRPYGLSVSLADGLNPDAFATILVAAFRRYEVIGGKTGFLHSLAREYRSTLLIFKDGGKHPGRLRLLDLGKTKSNEDAVRITLEHLSARIRYLLTRSNE
jgi:hypothetical protein